MNNQPNKTEYAGVSVETVLDVMYLIGLVFVFLGLGLAAGWGWGLLADGGILIGTALWIVAPSKPGRAE